MNILTMLWKNLWGGSRTMRFPVRPKVTEDYRGLVRFDPALCTGCAICKMRCTARAIEFQAPAKASSPGATIPGQCTFCGRCVEGCKDPCAQPGLGMPADLSDHRRVEELLHRCAQAARSKPAAATPPAAESKAAIPPLEARTYERPIENILTMEKLGVADPWVEKGGVHWLDPGRIESARTGQGDERRHARFITITAYQLPEDEGFRLEYHWDLDGQLLGFPFLLAGNSIESIFDLCEAVDWIEREIHEEYCLGLHGPRVRTAAAAPGR